MSTKRRSFRRAVVVAGLVGMWVVLGCRQEPPENGDSIAVYRERMLSDYQQARAESPGLTPAEAERAAPAATPVAEPRDPNAGPPRTALMSQPAATTQPTAEQVLAEMPDPSEAAATFDARRKVAEQKWLDELETRRQHGEDVDPNKPPREIVAARRVVVEANELLRQLPRSRQMRLTLADCVARALRHNSSIRIRAHDPAIEGTRLVEAEAHFDAEFFLNSSYATRDNPQLEHINSPSAGTQNDQRGVSGGIRKLLPTGLVASVSTGVDYYKLDDDRLPRGTNPVLNNNLIVSLQQPLLRGFGLDVNRAQIEIARAGQDIAYWQFLEATREQLLNVETAYWRLSQARRTAAILAESVAQNYVTWQDMVKRYEGGDATPVQVNNSLARWKSRYVVFLESVKDIRDAEDVLKNLLGDPEIKLSEETELIPIDTPLATPLMLDQFAEVRRALDARSEIRAARRVIDQYRIATGVAKNALLPQLDVNFSYEVDGTGLTNDRSFEQMADHRYISYNVGVTFSYPLGNRAAEAGDRRARLQESQAIAQLQQVTDGVVQEVNASARALIVRFAQLPDQFNAVQASANNLEALQVRAKAVDPAYLETELSAVEQLANNRTTLLQVLMDYNVAIVKLERDKGTLLEYNNVVVTERPPGEVPQPRQ